VLVPDIATSVPKPTEGGTTYTFTSRRGEVRAAGEPPGDLVRRPVRDRADRATEKRRRVPLPLHRDQGLRRLQAGKAKSITGITTPNAGTIVFHLTKPTGDFLYRLAMPATGPIPVEVAKCFEGQAGKYGRDVVSTGPYMFEGADKVGAGELEDENAPSLPPQALQRYATDSAKKQYLHLDPSDLVDYLTMNLTQPPFDDIHVRKAMNWVVDKAALRQIWGGPLLGKIAGHIVPDSIFDNQLADYDPYATAGEHGSLVKAKAAMRGSKYDAKHDGMCTPPPATISSCSSTRPLPTSRCCPSWRPMPRGSGSASTSRRSPAPIRRCRPRPRTSPLRPSRAGPRTPRTPRPTSSRSSTATASSRRGTRTTRSSAFEPRRRRRSG
jgi:ABC-type oligopeptide transport system substrate-binding subunit